MAGAPNLPASTAAQAHATLRRFFAAAFYLQLAVGGLVQFAVEESAPAYLLHALLIALTATYWAIEDSRLRGKPLLRVAQEIYFFTWPFASLGYLIGSRGWRGLGVWLLCALAAVILLVICQVAGAIIVGAALAQ